MPSQPNYLVKEHRLTKKVKRWSTAHGCCVETIKTLFVDSRVILEEVILSTHVDVLVPIEDDSYFK